MIVDATSPLSLANNWHSTYSTADFIWIIPKYIIPYYGIKAILSPNIKGLTGPLFPGLSSSNQPSLLYMFAHRDSLYFQLAKLFQRQ